MTATLPSTLTYAVRFLVHLAQAASHAVHCMDAATALDVPGHYLRMVATTLVRAGLLRSRRGPGGGFTLARSADEITMLDIVRAVHGVRPDPVMLPNAPPTDRRLATCCRQARNAYRRSLAQQTLASFITQ